ncbi:MAG: HAD-IIB family hydrolase [Sulfurospirillaceae bacterium]|nr:HAD-IIB family hydrolase [Sulfurospirillaceae bacterium]
MKTNKDNIDTIIFTDLDGTLLDHNTYSFAKAKEMLDFIKTNKIPLVIVSSKTKNEILQLQKSLKIDSTFIFENGAGVYISDDDVHKTLSLGFNIKHIQEAFERYKKTIHMVGFSDLSAKEVAKLTGLDVIKAGKAKDRLFTEPFILKDKNDIYELKDMAEKDGLDIVEGGRFFHLITKGQDKAKALEVVKSYYEEVYKKRFTSIALGDSQNDFSMLGCVDVPILIPHPDGSYMSCDIKNLIRAPKPGPEGWSMALKEYFDNNQNLVEKYA